MYRGSHATTFSRAKVIGTSGFTITPGHEARKGSGVYLWAESRRYLTLAKSWYAQKRRDGDFDTDKDPRGIILIAVAETTEDGYLDLEDQNIIDAIDEFVEVRRINAGSNSKISEAIDLFVDFTEKEIGVPIVLVGVRVTAPERCPAYNVRLRGFPLCYVVRRPEYLKIEKAIEAVDV